MNDVFEVPVASRRGGPGGLAGRAASAARAAAIAPDCSGLDFFAIDRGLQDLLPLYMDRDLLAHLTPHLHVWASWPVGA